MGTCLGVGGMQKREILGELAQLSFGGFTNIDENTKHVRRRRRYAMQEVRSGEVLEWRLSPGIVILHYVGLGIIINLFTGYAIFNYAVLGLC